MTERQKIAHLLRRFGFGGSIVELDLLERAGYEASLQAILNYESIDEGFGVSPWEFCQEEGSDQIYLEVPRMTAWWVFRMLTTNRALQEKLTLFWHDHFAVSGQKIEFGPMMLQYLDAIRKNASGNFKVLLDAVSKTPAMVKYLDNDSNLKDNPNENFAREVMELFTLGKGNYTEKDIQEAARAFTGWGIRYYIFELGGDKIQESMRQVINANRPTTAFCLTPDFHDTGTKTILGKTQSFDGDQVLNMLAEHPATARNICKKLWEFFAYSNPEPAIIERLAAVFNATKGEIKPVLFEIARSPEFFSDKAIRKNIKSPADFTISIVRATGAGKFLMGLRDKNAKPSTPIKKEIRDISGFLGLLMNNQGMLLLYPPDVGGWNWGESWINSNSMLERARHAEILFGNTKDGESFALGVVSQIKPRQKAGTTKGFVEALCDFFDASPTDKELELLVQACEKSGGVPNDGTTAAKVLSSVLKILFMSPNFQYC